MGSYIRIMIAGTFVQRCSVFLLTYVVYLGMGLSGISFVYIVLLQASIYVAVDMLPIPGAQGITETMYRVVFGTVFPGQCLVASMCVTRGISFYLIMIISFQVWGGRTGVLSGTCGLCSVVINYVLSGNGKATCDCEDTFILCYNVLSYFLTL